MEFDIIKELFNFNIYIIFILTNITKDDEDSSKNYLEDKLNDSKVLTQGEKEKILNNIYCIDLLDEQYSNKLSEILFKLYKEMEDSQKKNNLIIESIEDYNNLNKNKNNIYVPDNNINKEETETKETDFLLKKKKLEEGILSKKIKLSPSILIEMIKDLIKDNIFFNDLDTDRKNKYNLALNIVESYKKSAYWWGFIPIKWFSESSRKRMVRELSSLYEIVVYKRI